MKKAILGLTVLLIFSHCICFGEDSQNAPERRPSVGVGGGYGLNLHSSNFQKLPGVPNCCPKFESGLGGGASFGAYYEHPIFKEFSLGLLGGWTALSGQLSTTEGTTIMYNGKHTDGSFDHTIDGTFSGFNVQPYVAWNVWTSLSVKLGFDFVFLTQKSYSQKETISNPSDGGTFLDSLGHNTFSRTRNQFSGEIPNASSLLPSITLAVNYSFPLTKKGDFFVVPELNYSYGLSKIADGVDWSISSLRMGVSVKYIIPERKPIREDLKQFEKIDTIKQERPQDQEQIFAFGQPKLKRDTVTRDLVRTITETVSRTDTVFFKKHFILLAQVALVGVDSTGKELPEPLFTVEEFQATKMFPQLNYVFFDENSAVISDRYLKLKKADAESFSMNSLYALNRLDLYYHLLNIIGYRLKMQPDANITLTGCNSGENDEKSNLDLSRSRAESVRKYFVDNWGIDSARINIATRNLPDKPSIPVVEPEKQAENRRVELSFSNIEIGKPLTITDTVRTISPPLSRLKPTVKAEAGLDEWSIVVYQGRRRIKEFTGKDSIATSYDWQIEEAKDVIPILQAPLEYTINVKDKDKQTYSMPSGRVQIKQVTIEKKRSSQIIVDKQIDEFDLILFDFDKADLSAANKEIILNQIKPRIKPESKVEIVGYTDQLGEADHNKTLSLQRAKAVAKLLDIPDAFILGIGSEKLLHDNNHPEGRFLCRTVKIKIETPVDKTRND